MQSFQFSSVLSIYRGGQLGTRGKPGNTLRFGIALSCWRAPDPSKYGYGRLHSWKSHKDWWRWRSVAAVYNRPSVCGCARGSYCYKGKYLSKSSNSPLVTPIFYIRIGFRAKFRFRGSISELIYIYSYVLLSYIYRGDNQRTCMYVGVITSEHIHIWKIRPYPIQTRGIDWAGSQSP